MAIAIGFGIALIGSFILFSYYGLWPLFVVLVMLVAYAVWGGARTIGGFLRRRARAYLAYPAEERRSLRKRGKKPSSSIVATTPRSSASKLRRSR